MGAVIGIIIAIIIVWRIVVYFKDQSAPSDPYAWSSRYGGAYKSRISPDEKCPECGSEVREIWTTTQGTGFSCIKCSWKV